MKTTCRVAVVAFAASALAAALPARAHHSFAAEYDASKPVTLTGTVTAVQWTNPHIFIFVDVPDEKTGAIVNWTLEMGGPNALLRLGWKRDSLKTGDTLIVDTIGLRDDTWIDWNGSVVTEAAKIREEIRRPSFGYLEIRVTVDDPKAYTKPWTVDLRQRIVVDAELIDEVCLENETFAERTDELKTAPRE